MYSVYTLYKMGVYTSNSTQTSKTSVRAQIRGPYFKPIVLCFLACGLSTGALLPLRLRGPKAWRRLASTWRCQVEAVEDPLPNGAAVFFEGRNCLRHHVITILLPKRGGWRLNSLVSIITAGTLFGYYKDECDCALSSAFYGNPESLHRHQRMVPKARLVLSKQTLASSRVS